MHFCVFWGYFNIFLCVLRGGFQGVFECILGCILVHLLGGVLLYFQVYYTVSLGDILVYFGVCYTVSFGGHFRCAIQELMREWV